ATGASALRWAILSTLCLAACCVCEGAAAPGRRRHRDLADTGCATGGRAGGAAERGLVDELVLDDSIFHVRRVDQDRRQQCRGLLAPGKARRRRGRTV